MISIIAALRSPRSELYAEAIEHALRQAPVTRWPEVSVDFAAVDAARQPRVDQRDNPTLPGITIALGTFDGAGNFAAYAIRNFGGWK